jgi:hypothetical protein
VQVEDAIEHFVLPLPLVDGAEHPSCLLCTTVVPEQDDVVSLEAICAGLHDEAVPQRPASVVVDPSQGGVATTGDGVTTTSESACDVRRTPEPKGNNENSKKMWNLLIDAFIRQFPKEKCGCGTFDANRRGDPSSQVYLI